MAFRARRPILDHERRRLLRAALGQGDRAAQAYSEWRRTTRLDDIDSPTYRILPLLLGTAERNGLVDNDTRRMRGVAKHIWISNLQQTHPLAAALDALAAANIDALLLKGAALFALDNELSTVRAAGDYDLLVPRPDARRAIATLISAGFRTHFGIRSDRFTDADLDTIHAAHFVLDNETAGNLDLHWQPLPLLHDRELVDAMFAGAESVTMAGRAARIPSLAHQLFLSVARAEPWERDEMFLRAVEATLLVRVGKGKLDWCEFERLVVLFGYGWIAARMLQLIADEVEVAVPEGLAARLWNRQAPFNALEFRLRRTPPYQRTPMQRAVLQAVQIAKSQPTGSAVKATIAVVASASVRSELLHSVRNWTGYAKPDLPALWASRTTLSIPPGEPSFTRGFSLPEDIGRWTDDDVAILEIPVSADAGPLVQICLTVQPFAPWKPAFRFETATGPDVVEQHVLDTAGGSSPVDIELSARVVGDHDRKAVIVFRLPDAVRPKALGLSEDPRLLGLLLQNVAIRGKAAPAVAAE